MAYTGLLTAFTRTTDEARDEEFNRWYNGTHLLEVMAVVRDFATAQRFKVAPGVQLDGTTEPVPNPYLLLYDISESPGRAVEDMWAHRHDFEMTDTLDTGHLRVWSWDAASPVVGEGARDGGGRLLVISDSQVGSKARYKERYADIHLQQVVRLPGFAAGQLFEIADKQVPAEISPPPPGRFLAVYQLDAPCGEAVSAMTDALARREIELPGGGPIGAWAFNPIMDLIRSRSTGAVV